MHLTVIPFRKLSYIDRSYCYSKDTARATLLALFNDKADNQIINIGNSNTLISLTELAELITELCETDKIIEVVKRNGFEGTDRSAQREINTRYCDTSKAKETLGFIPEVSLRDGIKNVIKYGVFSPKWATSDKDYTLDDWV